MMFNRVVHPGAVLKDELDGLGITLSEFARQIDVPPNRVSQIIAGKRSVTGDTALRLGHWFGIDPQFWLNLQAQHDLAVADRETGEVIRHLPTRGGLAVRAEPSRVGRSRVDATK
jgi:antitoxin HigA-1